MDGICPRPGCTIGRWSSLFLETENRSELSSQDAIRIFDVMPERGDGEILKRDILGVGLGFPPHSVLHCLCPDWFNCWPPTVLVQC